MRKVVIAGSASLQEGIAKWKNYWESKEGYSVLAYPQAIPEDRFEEIYPGVHVDFFRKLTEADVLFVANEEKNGIDGYIGPETFAELVFGLAQKIVYGRDIKLILAYMPSAKVASYSEIVLWRKLGWIDEVLSERARQA